MVPPNDGNAVGEVRRSRALDCWLMGTSPSSIPPPCAPAGRIEQGFITLTDRAKDAHQVRGEWISRPELGICLYQRAAPGRTGAAVVGVPRRSAGRNVSLVAVVVVRRGHR